MANTANSLLSVLQLETNRMGSMHPEKNSQIFLSQFTKLEFVLAKKYLIMTCLHVTSSENFPFI